MRNKLHFRCSFSCFVELTLFMLCLLLWIFIALLQLCNLHITWNITFYAFVVLIFNWNKQIKIEKSKNNFPKHFLYEEFFSLCISYTIIVSHFKRRFVFNKLLFMIFFWMLIFLSLYFNLLLLPKLWVFQSIHPLTREYIIKKPKAFITKRIIW